MAWYDDAWDDVGDFFEDIEPPGIDDVIDILFGDYTTHDEHAENLFREAFFEGSDKAYIDLVDYMYDRYGIDFEATFDWEDFRAHYETA